MQNKLSRQKLTNTLAVIIFQLQNNFLDKLIIIKSYHQPVQTIFFEPTTTGTCYKFMRKSMTIRTDIMMSDNKSFAILTQKIANLTTAQTHRGKDV